MKRTSVALFASLCVLSCASPSIAQTLLVQAPYQMRESRVVLTAEAGYGGLLVTFEDLYSDTIVGGNWAHGAFVHFAVGYKLTPGLAVTYNFQGMSDLSGLYHTHTINLARIPAGTGFTSRAGLGVMVLNPYGRGSAAVGMAADTAIGAQFQITRSIRVTIDFPFGLAIPLSLDTGDTVAMAYTFGFQAGISWIG